MEEKKLLLIVNPRAGKTRSRAPFYDVIALFCQAGYAVSLRQTQERGEAEALARGAGGYDLVVCCGGDGTLNETVSGLLALKDRPPLGYIPCGSTNDFAASLSLPLQPPSAAARILDCPGRRLDVGQLNGRYFMYVAAFGAFTNTSYSTDQGVKNDLGRLAYVIEGMKSMSTLRPYQVRVTADGEVFEGGFLFGAVANATSIGGFLRLRQDEVVVDDGKFEMLLIPEPKNANDLQNLIMSLLRSDFTGGGLLFRHVSHIILETKEDLPWSLDGEFEPGAGRVEIRNLQRLLEMRL